MHALRGDAATPDDGVDAIEQLQVARLMADTDDPVPGDVRIDVDRMTVRSASVDAAFTLTPRHRRMLLEGMDVIGLSLAWQAQIDAFAAAHWARHPWLKDVPALTRRRLDGPKRPA